MEELEPNLLAFNEKLLEIEANEDGISLLDVKNVLMLQYYQY